MSNKNIVYRPPESDSEDDYDGFFFGDDIVKKPKQYCWRKEEDQQLYEAILNGNLDIVKQKIDIQNFNVDEPVNDGFTLLLHACQQGFFDIVEYLVLEKKANVNKDVGSITPLMAVCDSLCKDSSVIEKIAKLLINHGAIIDVADRYGTTPLMLACKNGYTNIVHLIMDDVSLDTHDNQGSTPIFHAIENNRADIVKILIDAGVDYKKANSKGYTPLQVAQFHGFCDLVSLFPKEKETYLVPSEFLAYNSLRDYIPRIFLKSECPEYFQEVSNLLQTLSLEHFVEYFAKGRISFGEFLCMTDEKLKGLGIMLPLHRMKIIKGLLNFHLHHWSKKSISRIKRSSQDNFYEILMITANHMQHLVIINSTIKFVKNHLENDLLGSIDKDCISNIRKNLRQYKHTLKELQNISKYLASFSPAKSPLYIDYDEFLAERKRMKFKCYFKYTLAIGLSVFICLKFKRLL